MSDDTNLPPISGTFAPGSMAAINSVITDGVLGEASGTVSGEGIEAALAQLEAPDAAPPAPLVPEPAVSPAAQFFKIKVEGAKNDAPIYISNGDLELVIPRNEHVRVPALALEVLKQTQGIEFTYLTD